MWWREGGAEGQERNQRYCLVCISQLWRGKGGWKEKKGNEKDINL
jgi:hypothetical protein